jgi:hypothetical protein
VRSQIEFGNKGKGNTMSLTSFVKTPDVIEKIKPLRPKLPRKISATLKVQPRSNRYTLVGTAFDYLLRFELNRRAPHAIAERWVAENAPIEIGWSDEKGSVGVDLLKDADPQSYMSPDQVVNCMNRILHDAKKAVASFIRCSNTTREMQAEMAAHAIRLAKLDSVYRAMRLEPHFQKAESEDVDDLLELLSVVPFDMLFHNKLMLLNPNFKQVSLMVGGADTDLITGNLLVDFKTTKKGEMDASVLDQLLGYFLLARKLHQSESSFPVIDRLGLYFCRHGYLWSVPSNVWTQHPQFPEIEQWFFKRAVIEFGREDHNLRAKD